MKDFIKKIWGGQTGVMIPTVAFLSAFFLCGAVAGCIAAKGIEGDADNTLLTYVTEYLSLSKSGTPTGPILGRAFFNTFKYHAGTFLCGFSLLGLIFVPALLVVRGFFLSFAITSFIVIFGLDGMFLSLGVFGFSCLITLPFLLVISAQSFIASYTMLQVSVGKKKPSTPVLTKEYFLRFGFCAVILSFCALFEALVTPLIVSSIASYIV